MEARSHKEQINKRDSQAGVLAVIPARGGSKGVVRKNIRPVCGRPLIAYTIDTAKAAGHLLYRTIVSTDDPEIEAIARKEGAEVPFLRPKELAGDKVPTLPVLQHAVQAVEKQDNIKLDWVLLLQPTSPLRTLQDIEASLDLAFKNDCDSVISVVQVFAEHPTFIKRIENNQLLPFVIEEKEGTRRQDCQPPAYIRNGAIYMTRRDVLMGKDSIWGQVIRPYIMPAERSINVDSELELKFVELMVREQNKIKLEDK